MLAIREKPCYDSFVGWRWQSRWRNPKLRLDKADINMAKKQGQVEGGAVEQPVVEQAAVEQPVAGPNYTLTYRRDHPSNRCSYGIAGVKGIVVFDFSMFADGKAPATITLDCELAQPKGDAKAERAAAVAAKAADRAAKAQARADAAAAKIADRAAKAAAALDAAKAKVAATAGGGAVESTDAPAS